MKLFRWSLAAVCSLVCSIGLVLGVLADEALAGLAALPARSRAAINLGALVAGVGLVMAFTVNAFAAGDVLAAPAAGAWFNVWWLLALMAIVAVVLFLVVPEGKRSLWIHGVLGALGGFWALAAPVVDNLMGLDWAAVLPPQQVGLVLFVGHAIAAFMRGQTTGPVR